MTLDKFNNPFSNFRLGFHNGAGNPLDVGLLAYYTLDEVSGDRIDCSPNGLDQSVVGTVGFTNDGVLSGAADFTLLGGLESAADPVIDALIGGSFTIATWVLLRTDTSGNVVSISNGGLNTNSLTSLFYDFNSKSYVGFVSDGVSGDFFGATVNGFIPFNAWIHAVITFDADTEGYQLILNNGNPISNNLGAQTSTIPLQKLAIGRSVDGGLPFDGFIDETAYYDRVLEADEITHYFQGGGLLNSIVAAYFFNDTKEDESPNDILLFSSGGFGFADGVIDRAGNFQGTFARLDSLPSTALDALRENSFSATVWAYVDSGVSQRGLIFGVLAANSVPNRFITIHYDFSTDSIEAGLFYNGGASIASVFQDIGGSIPKDTFFSIQLTFDEPTLTFRMRLNLQSFGSTVLGSTTDNSANQRIVVGALLGGGENLFGRVDELYFFDEVRTDIQLNTTYMNGLATRPYLAGRAPCAPEFTDDFNNDFNDDFN